MKLIGIFFCLALMIAVLILTGSNMAYAQTRQGHIHHKSHAVMPFDISKTIHIFKMTEFGGIQKVISRDPKDSEQIALIRRHLQNEAKMFQAGNYSDPAKLHGVDMPGLKELQDGVSRIKVTYAELPSGAQIKFETIDLGLLTAIHRWFGAQLSEHGADARAE